MPGTLDAETQRHAPDWHPPQWQVLVADTEHAVALAAHANVIVTGIRVPDPFEGIELVRRSRTQERTKHKPSIVLSAGALPSDQDGARAVGCTMFLSKPCLPDAVARVIRTLLEPTSDAAGTKAARTRG